MSGESIIYRVAEAISDTPDACSGGNKEDNKKSGNAGYYFGWYYKNVLILRRDSFLIFYS